MPTSSPCSSTTGHGRRRSSSRPRSRRRTTARQRRRWRGRSQRRKGRRNPGGRTPEERDRAVSPPSFETRGGISIPRERKKGSFLNRRRSQSQKEKRVTSLPFGVNGTGAGSPRSR